MKKIFTLILVGLIAINLAACNSQSKQKSKKDANFKILKITQIPTSSALYFSGSVLPLKITPVISSAAGTVDKIKFSYGQSVKKGQLLLTIKSSKRQSTYQTALTKYLQAKQTFSQSKKQYDGDKQLWNKGLIPTNTYETSKSTYLLNQLTLLQTEGQLKGTLNDQDINKLKNLSIENFAAVNKALELNKTAATINIFSPASGEVLFPNQASNKIKTGLATKKEQVLLNIDSSSGISFDIKINEINVNQLHVGQPATITSVAFPNITLQGYIKTIDAQASTSGGLPSFFATIIVPKLADAQSKIIRIGMSAKISVTTTRKARILVPIYAISEENGKKSVKLLDPKTGKTRIVTVETGETTLSDVEIISGLKTGDQVVLPN